MYSTKMHIFHLSNKLYTSKLSLSGWFGCWINDGLGGCLARPEPPSTAVHGSPSAKSINPSSSVFQSSSSSLCSTSIERYDQRKNSRGRQNDNPKVSKKYKGVELPPISPTFPFLPTTRFQAFTQLSSTFQHHANFPAPTTPTTPTTALQTQVQQAFTMSSPTASKSDQSPASIYAGSEPQTPDGTLSTTNFPSLPCLVRVLLPPTLISSPRVSMRT
jgi:hypothetical protein